MTQVGGDTVNPIRDLDLIMAELLRLDTTAAVTELSVLQQQVIDLS